MSNRDAGLREASPSPKSNGRSEAGDPLDAAGHHTMDLLHRAAVAAEANYQQAIGGLTNCRLNFGPMKTGSGSSSQKSAITMKERTAPRNGCTKFRCKSSSNFLEATLAIRHSHLIRKRPHETSRDSLLRIALVRATRPEIATAVSLPSRQSSADLSRTGRTPRSGRLRE
jgi:hypothetical protein